MRTGAGATACGTCSGFAVRALQVCQITFARIQGKNAMVQHFQNSSLLQEDKRCRPVLFHSEGPLAGAPEVPPTPPHPTHTHTSCPLPSSFMSTEVLRTPSVYSRVSD